MPASFGAAIGNDYKVVDSPETVTFAQGGVSRTVTGAVRYEVSRREVLASGGLLTGQEIVFELPAAAGAWSASVLTPQEGAKITDAGGVAYSVLERQTTAWETIFRCVCKRDR